MSLSCECKLFAVVPRRCTNETCDEIRFSARILFYFSATVPRYVTLRSCLVLPSVIFCGCSFVYIFFFNMSHVSSCHKRSSDADILLELLFELIVYFFMMFVLAFCGNV